MDLTIACALLGLAKFQTSFFTVQQDWKLCGMFRLLTFLREVEISFGLGSGTTCIVEYWANYNARINPQTSPHSPPSDKYRASKSPNYRNHSGILPLAIDRDVIMHPIARCDWGRLCYRWPWSRFHD